MQFTLRTLLLVVSSLAAALGAVRWLGAEVVPFILVAVGIWLTARTKARHLLVWLVAALWSMCAFGSWHHRVHQGFELVQVTWVLPQIGQAFGFASQRFLLSCRDFAKVVRAGIEPVDQLSATIEAVEENVVIVDCHMENRAVEFLGDGFRHLLVLAVIAWVHGDPTVVDRRNQELAFSLRQPAHRIPDSRSVVGLEVNRSIKRTHVIILER